MCSLLSIIDSITGIFCNEIRQVLNATKLLIEKNILHKEIFDVINYNLIKLNCHKYNWLAKKKLIKRIQINQNYFYFEPILRCKTIFKQKLSFFQMKYTMAETGLPAY